MASTDLLQIFVEDPQGDTTIRPYAFGTDAIERMRVSLPESMIDADFEYGLQPTKWAGYGTVKGYPSVYQNEGIDIEYYCCNDKLQFWFSYKLFNYSYLWISPRSICWSMLLTYQG